MLSGLVSMPPISSVWKGGIFKLGRIVSMCNRRFVYGEEIWRTVHNTVAHIRDNRLMMVENMSSAIFLSQTNP